MRVFAIVAAVMLAGAMTGAASAQVVDISDLLGMLGGGGISPGGVGGSPTTGPGDGDGVLPGDQDLGEIPEGEQETLIPQENLRAARSRRPGLWVNAGMANFQERTANVGVVGPSQVPKPEVDEGRRVMPTIINDLLGSFFDIVNTVVNGLSLFTTIQSGLAGGGGLSSGGIDFQSLLQQLLGTQSRTTDVVPQGSDVMPENSATLPPGEAPALQPEPAESVVIPAVPGR